MREKKKKRKRVSLDDVLDGDSSLILSHFLFTLGINGGKSSDNSLERGDGRVSEEMEKRVPSSSFLSLSSSFSSPSAGGPSCLQ